VRARPAWIALCFTAALTACATSEPSAPPRDSAAPTLFDETRFEECGTAGDEDGNGLADCDDPACAEAPSCQPACGDHQRDPGEECDDGNTLNGDGCEADCTLPRCGNAIVDAGEECDDGNDLDGDRCEADCTSARCGNAIRDAGESCDDGNVANGDGCDSGCGATAALRIKASNARSDHQFGMAVAISADGSTLAVGAPMEDSAATGIDGDQGDSSAPSAGAVYVYAWGGDAWVRQTYVKASNTGEGDMFGASVALSADGSTLAVGALAESSAARGIGGDQSDNSASLAGAVYVFARQGATWHQEAYIKASNADATDQFGASVALSANGATLAVGAIGESSAATGVAGSESDNSASFAGAVYVLGRTGANWQQLAYIKASNTGAGDCFGTSVALSGDGSTLAVSAAVEDSAARGINGNAADNSAASSGAAYVFTSDGTGWRQDAYVKASNTGRADNFGTRVALSSDGSTLAVGAPGEDSSATGIGGNQASNGTLESGAVYVYTRTGLAWSQQAYVKASNTGIADQFGWAIALSTDGSMMAVGAITEDSAARGIGGDQTDNSATASGAVYMFRRDRAAWHQQAYIKATNTDDGDQFGWSVALSSDGTLAVGTPAESGTASGTGNDPDDPSALFSGAVFTYR